LNDRSTIELTAVDEDNRSSIVKVYYRWGSEPPNIYKNPVKIPESINTFSYWAEDLAGNEMDTRSIQVKKDSTLPLIFLDTNGLRDGALGIGETLNVDLTGSSDDSGVQSYSIDYYGAGTFDWTPDGVFEHFYAQPGTYEVTVNIKDAAGNIVNQSFTVKVKEEEKTPVQAGGSSGMDSGILMIVVGIGAAVLILIVALGVVLVVVRNRQAQQLPIQKPGPAMPPVKNSPPGLPPSLPGSHPSIPPKPPVRPLPPVQ
jgi:PKD domain-containing protein